MFYLTVPVFVGWNNGGNVKSISFSQIWEELTVQKLPPRKVSSNNYCHLVTKWIEWVNDELALPVEPEVQFPLQRCTHSPVWHSSPMHNSCIVACCGNSNVQRCKKLQGVVDSVIGTTLPTIPSIYMRCCLKELTLIIGDPHYPGKGLI